MKQFKKLFWQFSPWRTWWYYWDKLDDMANPILYKTKDPITNEALRCKY